MTELGPDPAFELQYKLLLAGSFLNYYYQKVSYNFCIDVNGNIKLENEFIVPKILFQVRKVNTT